MTDDDCGRWCLRCFRAVVWQPLDEYWVHDATRLYLCDPTEPDGDSAAPAPAGTRGIVPGGAA
jgi:hypothetical protein